MYSYFFENTNCRIFIGFQVYGFFFSSDLTCLTIYLRLLSFHYSSRLCKFAKVVGPNNEAYKSDHILQVTTCSK